MSNLPREGKAPDQTVKVQPPKAAPRESLITIGQFAAVRKLKNKLGGFKQECKPNLSKRTLQAWDELFAEYWDKPIRG